MQSKGGGMYLLVPWSFSVAKASWKKEEKKINQHKKKYFLMFFFGSFTIYLDTFMWHTTHDIHKKNIGPTLSVSVRFGIER